MMSNLNCYSHSGKSKNRKKLWTGQKKCEEKAGELVIIVKDGLMKGYDFENLKNYRKRFQYQ